MTTPAAPADPAAPPPEVFSLQDPESLRAGLRAARVAVGKKQLVVIPTDTHYAVAADAFSPAALAALSRFKGWQDPPTRQVLLPSAEALHALADSVPEAITALTESLWPGPLTVVLPAGSSLRWSVGEGVDSVGLSLIAHPVIRELLIETGPLVVSAAHPAGQSPEHPEGLEALIAGGHPDLAVVLVDEKLPWDFSTPGSTVVEVVGEDEGAEDEGAEDEGATDEGAEAKGAAASSADRVSLRLLREGLISSKKVRSILGDGVAWRE